MSQIKKNTTKKKKVVHKRFELLICYTCLRLQQEANNSTFFLTETKN